MFELRFNKIHKEDFALAKVKNILCVKTAVSYELLVYGCSMYYIFELRLLFGVAGLVTLILVFPKRKIQIKEHY